MTATTVPLAHAFFDREARLWGIADSVEDTPGFIGPVQRWTSFNKAHDTAQDLNRERHGTHRGLWT